MQVKLEGKGSTKCFPDLPIPPWALAETELPKTTVHACRKINRDHFAGLASLNREDFAYYQYREKTILLYAGEVRMPPRVTASGPQLCGGNKKAVEL